MSITIKNISDYLEKIAPLNQAEDFDNVGLLIGNETTEVKGVLVTLDTLEDTIDEAIKKNCNLIISFHPIIFSGLKKINGNSYVERVVLKAIQNNIAIYAVHTALDNHQDGVNKIFADALGLKNVKGIHSRAEEINQQFDFVISRAVTQFNDFYPWVKGKFLKKSQNDLANGILYLKGGDLTEEMKNFSQK